MAARRVLEWIGTLKAQLVFRYEISDLSFRSCYFFDEGSILLVQFVLCSILGIKFLSWTSICDDQFMY